MAKLLLVTFTLVGLFISLESKSINRIVGGTDAYEGQFGYQISLRRNGQHTCGGSIITRRYILTAAHCVGNFDFNHIYYTYNPEEITVRAGSKIRLQGGVLRKVEKIIAHENYANFLNDVALLRLTKNLIYSQYIKSIPLATKELSSGTLIVISGWGRLEQGGDIPLKLQWNNVTSLTQQECYDRINYNSPSLICLAHPVDNGACNGDSGGPAVYNGELVGVAGFVVQGCGSKNPDGYAKVSYHYDWIKTHSDL